jgi:hypothetical protein
MGSKGVCPASHSLQNLATTGDCGWAVLAVFCLHPLAAHCLPCFFFEGHYGSAVHAVALPVNFRFDSYAI